MGMGFKHRYYLCKSEASDNFVTGQLNKTKLQDALNNGTLNPFGESSDPNIWNSLSVKGKYNEATLESTTADFSISRPILLYLLVRLVLL